ncbi:MAG: Hpt domain-containing protein, partial [Betaproteobacteria bacterium]
AVADGDASPLLDRRSALQRMGGDEALYQRLLDRLAEREAHAPQYLRQALSDGDREAARRIVHNLKGLAGNIGAEALAAACRRLEYHLDTSGIARDEALQAWETSLANLLAALAAGHRPTEQRENPATPGTPDRQALEELMRSLGRQLKDDDAKATRTAGELARLLVGQADGGAAEMLAVQVNKFDYDVALARLKDLAANLKIAL